MAKKKAGAEGLNLEDLADEALDVVASSPEIVADDTRLFIDGEDESLVRFTLPKAVLFALLDPAFEGSDIQRAETLGLSADGKPTELGERVINGADVIALRHKMTAAYRAAQYVKMGGKAS